MSAPASHDDIANRQFHLRYSFDPILTEPGLGLTNSPEAKALIRDMKPYKTGNAAAMLEARDEVRGMAKERGLHSVWISFSDAGNGTPISVSELKLIAALFCHQDED